MILNTCYFIKRIEQVLVELDIRLCYYYYYYYILTNYCPVSNLTFISKVIENVVSEKLNEDLIKYIMSTETALIKVQNDILSALDAGSSAILLMLDLSAAFDTIDHDILLSRLCSVYGITDDALD